MRERLIEPAELWLFDRAGLALALCILGRTVERFLLWGGHYLPWQAMALSVLDSALIALLVLLALQGLVQGLVPRAYAAACGVLTGGACYLAALSMLTRYGWPLRWPLGPLPPAWLIAAGLFAAAVAGLRLWLRGRWAREIAGHGIEWTRLWAQEKPYSARKFALRALRYMGDWESQ
jgi:hypothetical protein